MTREPATDAGGRAAQDAPASARRLPRSTAPAGAPFAARVLPWLILAGLLLGLVFLVRGL